MSGWPPGGEAYDVQPVAGEMPGSVVLPGFPPAVTAVLGADPGSTTGLCLLLLARDGGRVYIVDRLVFGCNAEAVFALAQFLLEISEGPANIVAAGEAFVPGRGAGARGPGAKDARKVIRDLEIVHEYWHWHPAVEVKRWATDDRLKYAGLYDMTAKMIDARDAARHALFAAVRYAGLPDPLIAARKAARRPRPTARVPGNLDGMDD